MGKLGSYGLAVDILRVTEGLRNQNITSFSPFHDARAPFHDSKKVASPCESSGLSLSAKTLEKRQRSFSVGQSWKYTKILATPPSYLRQTNEGGKNNIWIHLIINPLAQVVFLCFVRLFVQDLVLEYACISELTLIGIHWKYSTNWYQYDNMNITWKMKHPLWIVMNRLFHLYDLKSIHPNLLFSSCFTKQ